ncbi:MAG: YqgE/AlgH family protein [Alphaproteobacteria bacterium]|nr:YqgE/AlgH family protein [Alphaproteobacteria bacterium]
MALIEDKYLSGQLLISSPKMDDECFAKSVIYLCSHGKEGAMGFIINKKLKDFSFSDLAVPMDRPSLTNMDSIFLYQGGPVEKIRGFVLHSAEYCKPGTYQVNKNIAVSSSLDVLQDIIYGVGPKDNLVALGYCAWQSNQLEREIINNDWFVTDVSNEFLFHTDDEDKWQKAMDETHVDLSRFIYESAHA